MGDGKKSYRLFHATLSAVWGRGVGVGNPTLFLEWGVGWGGRNPLYSMLHSVLGNI